MALLIFQDAEKARDAVCAEDQKKIRQLYEDWAEEVGQRAKYYAGKTTASSYWQEQQLLELQRQLTEQSKVIANQIYTGTKESLYTVADSVVGCNAKFLADLGFSKDGLQAAFSDVPTQVVNSIVTGQIYQGGWNLSSAIWGDNEKTLSDIYQIVAQGRAMNMSAYDVSKLLEQYVNPNKAKQWNLVMGDGRRIYKKSVDYNAQRLVRTLTQHAYQQGIIQMAKANPFVQSIIWHSNGSRVCELCQSRDGNEYQANNLPMDHPNGMCVMEPKVDMDSTVDQLVDWFNAEDGTYPEIDAFATWFGYTPGVKSLGTSKGKTFNYWYTKLSDKQKLLAQQLKSQSGLTWQQWYEKNIYAGANVAKATKSAVSDRTIGNLTMNDLLKLFGKQNESNMLSMEARAFAKMLDSQSAGISMYTGSSYHAMNAYLRLLAAGKDEAYARSKSGITSQQLVALNNARAGLANATLEKSIVVRRGTDLGDLAGFMPGDFSSNRNFLYGLSVEELNKKFAGTVGCYAGFTSTSSLWDRGFDGDVEVILTVPQGSQASSIMSISRFGTGEGETLLNAGTMVYIDRIEKSDNHMSSTIRVFMDVIGVKP